jgi:hypothetical protein
MALETQVIAGKSITFDPEVRDENINQFLSEKSPKRLQQLRI